MITTEELIKKFDNVFPVRTIEVPIISNDGTSKVRTLFDIDYEGAERIRAQMTLAEKERQRSIV